MTDSNKSKRARTMAKKLADHDAQVESLARNFKVVGEISDAGLEALAELLIDLVETEEAKQTVTESSDDPPQ